MLQMLKLLRLLKRPEIPKRPKSQNNHCITTRNFSNSNFYKPHLQSNRLKLTDLKDNPGARRKKTRRGRGHNSGHGRKSGRGMKGKKAHSGLVRIDYIGGAKPLHLKIPKKGFNYSKKEFDVVSLGKIGSFIKSGRLSTNKPITMKVMVDSGLLSKAKNGVKIVGPKKSKNNTTGSPFKHRVLLEATFASKSAKSIVEANGGKISLVWFTRTALRAHLYPWKFEFLPRSNGLPPPKYFGKFPSLMEVPPNAAAMGLSFEERVKLMAENGESEKIQKELKRSFPRETEEGKATRLKKKRFYVRGRKALPAIPAEIRNDPVKLKLLELRCRVQHLVQMG